MRNLSRLIALLAAFVSLAAGVTACADDPAPSTVAADDDGADDDGDDADGDDDAVGSDDDTRSDADPPSDTEAEYCAVSDRANGLLGAFDPVAATPEEVEAFYPAYLALVDEALALVPDDLRAALETHRGVTVATIEVLEPVGWDFESVIDELTPIYTAPDVEASDAALEEFDIEVCGFEPLELTPGDGDDATTDDEAVEVPAEYAAYCDASFEASQGDDLAPDATPEEAKAYYDDLVATLDAITELAPPELVDAIATIRATFAEVIAIMEGVEWDLDEGFALLEEWAADPEVAEPMDAALAVVEGFDEDVCGIVY